VTFFIDCWIKSDFTANFKWEKVEGSKAYGTAQVYHEKIYFFGGTKEAPHNYLAIYDTSRKFWYEVARKGDVPLPGYDFLSAVHGGQLMIFNGKSTNQQQKVQSSKYIYCINLEKKPVKNFIEKVVFKRAMDSGQQNTKEKEILKEVQKILEEKTTHDVVFIVNNQRIPAHKHILSLRSSYFSNMFSSGMQESHQKEIIISDISQQPSKLY